MTAPIKVVQFTDNAQLKKDISYSTADIHGAMSEQASLFVHYGIGAADASRQVDRIKMLLEASESTVYRKLRDEAATAGTKITEVQLEKQVAIHPTIIKVKHGLNEAKHIEAVAKIAVEGFRHRKDMLIQQGAYSREEMKGEVSIAARNLATEASQSQRDRVLQNIKDKAAT